MALMKIECTKNGWLNLKFNQTFSPEIILNSHEKYSYKIYLCTIVKIIFSTIFSSSNFSIFKMFKDPKLALAILTVALVWGTTFLGIRIAVESIPPWFVAGIRQFIAGLILLILLLSSKNLKWIGWKNFGNQIVLASLMLIIANGMTTSAQKHLTSSLAHSSHWSA